MIENNKELRQKYNPEGSQMRKAQLRMLDMLLYVDKVCKENNITYWLASGNLLGAVRHEGFIPWDDDLDIFVYKPKDCKKLFNLLENCKDSRFAFQSHKTDKYYIRFWNTFRDVESEYVKDEIPTNYFKYKGLVLDIFPQNDNVIPFLKKVFMKLYFKNTFDVCKKSVHLANFNYYILFFILKCFRFLSCFKLSRNYLSMDYVFPDNYRWKKSDVFPLSTIQFEGHYFPCPKNLDAYLKVEYGDYMKLPAEENRNQHNVDCINL